jgi:spore germination protein YaaH
MMRCCGWCHDREDLGAAENGILLMDYDDHYWGLVSILGYNHNQSYIIPILVLYQ